MYDSVIESKRKLWVHGPKPEFELDDDWADQYYIAARVAALLIKGDCIVLPGGRDELRQWWKFLVETLGYDEDQVIWTTGRQYLLDHDIRDDLRGFLGLLDDQWVLNPYSITGPFLEWKDLTSGALVFGDMPNFTAYYANKGGLHPSIRDPTGDFVYKAVSDRVRLPRGYGRCINLADVRRAWELLGRIPCVLKPELATTGEGIVMFEDPTQLGELEGLFHMGPVVVQERLAIERFDDGQQITPSIQFNGSKPFATPVDQIIGDGCAFEGLRWPSKTYGENQLTYELRRAVSDLLEFMNPQGPGGFDFAVVDGQPILLDVNVGRSTGSHPARMFQAMNAPRAPFVAWKVVPSTDIWSFWEQMKRKELAFDRSTGIGVFPLCYLPGMWGMLMYLGPEECFSGAKQQATEAALSHLN